MNLQESLNLLRTSGYKVLKEGRYNEYSDIGMDPGWDGWNHGWFQAPVIFDSSDELEELSLKLFNDKDYLYNIGTEFVNSGDTIYVKYYYNERGHTYSNYEWDTDTYSDNLFEYFDADILETIEDDVKQNKISCDINYVTEHLSEICAALQNALDNSIENLDYEHEKFLGTGDEY